MGAAPFLYKYLTLFSSIHHGLNLMKIWHTNIFNVSYLVKVKTSLTIDEVVYSTSTQGKSFSRFVFICIIFSKSHIPPNYLVLLESCQ